MASVFLYHVVGDLTVGKPEVVEFHDGETVEAAILAIGESTEGGIAVWKKRTMIGAAIENPEMRQSRFVGILNSLDIVAFLARSECLEDRERALKTPVSEVIVPNYSVLRQVDPATRLIDALEMMKQGVKRLLVRKSVVWKGMSKRFSILYNGKWLKNIDGNSSSNLLLNPNRLTTSTKIQSDKFCCLSREDILRFIIGCLGALAPLPLSSISTVGAINPNYYSIEASCPAMEVAQKLPIDPTAIAVVEHTMGNQYRIIGEISSTKLWKCDHLAAAWALANLSAGQFVMGVEDSRSIPDVSTDQTVGNKANGGGSATRLRKFSSRSIGFNPGNSSFGTMYRGRSAPLTCRVTSSLAAVMAQMLSHRATHVWVIDDENDDDVLVGVVSYTDILAAVSKPPAAVATANRSCNDGLVNEIQS